MIKGDVNYAKNIELVELFDINFEFDKSKENEIINYRMKNSKNDILSPYNHEIWQYLPIDLISILNKITL